MKKIISYDEYKLAAFENLDIDIDQYSDAEITKVLTIYSNKFIQEIKEVKEKLVKSNIITESSSEEVIDELIKDKMYPKHLNVKDYLWEA